MNSHLNDDQFTDALAHLAGERERLHLEECEECRSRMEAVSALFRSFGQQARHEAERKDEFWKRQGLVIASRLEQSARGPVMHMVWGAVAATAAALVIWAVMSDVPSSQPVQPAPRQVATQHENDELLLRQVEAALERGAPSALAPAEVLTHELNQSASDNRKQAYRSKN